MNLTIEAPSKTLVLMRGLPCSGKSTKAKTYNAPIVCPDSYRHVLLGQGFYAPAEPMIWVIVDATIRHYFDYGYPVVVLDATNHNNRRIDEWRNGPWKVEIDTLYTSEEECIERAEAIGRHDLISRIRRMSAEKNW